MTSRLLHPYTAFPALALVFVLITAVAGSPDKSAVAASVAFSIVMIAVMMGTVFAAVHHADVVALRTGEPYGTLVLTLAVTIIEVALIESIALTPGSSPALARDTVFAVIMIVCNGLVGLCILIGGIRHYEQDYQTQGTSAYLIVLTALATLTLVVPNYTLTVPGPYFSGAQIVFVSVITLALYGAFLFIQTVRHTEYFRATDDGDPTHHHERPTDRELVFSIVLLLVSLGGVILIAKKFAAIMELALDYVGAPGPLGGIIVATIVLTPESIAAVRAARANVLQKSVNLALGSALATIGLTIPAVAVTALVLNNEIVLGLSARDTVLLALTLFMSLLTFGTGRTNMLSGFVHLVVFVTFLFLVFVP
jgi:Ca2+:H+ antiporter